ncbi:hypothetical protein EDB80DRAFT_896389 [Ilyonectria destructans]|nr:hypothetical protein EDB80DRAFT_896389 [Ilyonectria destructans]
MRSWLILSALIGLATAICYFPSGGETGDEYKPCGADNTNWSTCCLEGDMCLENGLCQEVDGDRYRGPCDNPEGNGCYQVCKAVFGLEYVDRCTSNHYCCLGNATSCCNNNATEQFTVYNEPTSHITTTSSSTSSSPSKPVDSAETTSTSPNPPKSVPVGAIAGGAVGGIVVLAAVGGLIWLLLRGRKLKPNARDYDWVKMKPVVEMDSAQGVVEIDRSVRMHPLVEMEDQITPTTVQPYSQSTMWKTVFEMEA